MLLSTSSHITHAHVQQLFDEEEQEEEDDEGSRSRMSLTKMRRMRRQCLKEKEYQALVKNSLSGEGPPTPRRQRHCVPTCY
jgi:hypothetical protein